MAMKEELEALVKNDTMEFVDLRKWVKHISSKWIYEI